MKRLDRVRKLFGFLRQHRHELFDDAFQDELEGMYRKTGAGESPVPPAQLYGLHAIGEVAMERWLGEGPLPPAAAPALGIQVTTPAAATPNTEIELGRSPTMRNKGYVFVEPE
jgi:hypothetical protein